MLFDLAYHGKGGFPYDVAYSMPVYLRNINYKFLTAAIKKEQEEIDKIQKNSKPSTSQLSTPFGNKPVTNGKAPSNFNVSKYKGLI